MTIRTWLAIGAGCALASAAVYGGAPAARPAAKIGEKPPLSFASEEFLDGETLPVTATCDGEGKSPSLIWSGTKQATRSFALVFDEPELPNGARTHWLLYDIPKETVTIAHGGTAGISGKNATERTGFLPVCPAQGTGPHRYVFHLYALDVASLQLPAGASREEVEVAMKEHVVADARMTGVYERR